MKKYYNINKYTQLQLLNIFMYKENLSDELKYLYKNNKTLFQTNCFVNISYLLSQLEFPTTKHESLCNKWFKFLLYETEGLSIPQRDYIIDCLISTAHLILLEQDNFKFPDKNI